MRTLPPLRSVPCADTRTVKLVNRDQLDILAALREEVSIDKRSFETEVADLRTKLRDAKDGNAMQLAQINKLLLDKVGMQGDGIESREMLLKQERAIRRVSFLASRTE